MDEQAITQETQRPFTLEVDTAVGSSLSLLLPVICTGINDWKHKTMEVKEKTKTSNLSPRAKEDYEYVQQAISGDQKAYTVLLERYRNSIYDMMFKMVNNREDADDLTLEAFGKAFSKLPSYAPRYAFSTWLFKIAINNCIDHIR